MANKIFNLLDELNWITSGEPVSGDFRTGNTTVEGVANRVPRQLQGLIQAIAPMLSTDLGAFRSRFIEEQEKLDLRYNSIVILPKTGGGTYATFQIDRTISNYRDGGYCYVTNQTTSNLVIDDIRDISDTKSQITLAPGRSIKLVPYLYTSSDTTLIVKAESIPGFDGVSLTSTIEKLPAPMSLPKGITIWHTGTRARLLSKGTPEVNGNNSGIMIGISTGVDVNSTNGFSALLIGINKLGVITLRSSFSGSYNSAYTDGDATDGIIIDNRQVTADGQSNNTQSGQTKWQPRYEIKPTYNASTTKDGIVNIFDESITPSANTVIGAQTYLALLDKINKLTSTVEDTRYSNSTADSQSKTTTEDPNTTRDSLLLTLHRNCPTEGRTYWVQTYFNKNTRLRWQTATWADPSARNGATIVYARTSKGEDGSTNQWTPWTQINTANQVDAATDNTFTGSNTFNKGITIKGLLANVGSHSNENSTNKNAPLYVEYENSQLKNAEGDYAYPLARIKVNDSAFTTGVVGVGKANTIATGYHALVTPDGVKTWFYKRNGDFVANSGDIINSNGEKLSDALLYRGTTTDLDKSNLKSGHYIVGNTNTDKLRSQFVEEATTQGITLSTDADYQLLQINSAKQDVGLLVGDTSTVYLRVDETGNNAGTSVTWSQLITNKNIASTTAVGAVKLASAWDEQTQNVVPVPMFKTLIENSIIVGEGNYGSNTTGISNLSNLEPWGLSAVGVVNNYTNIESHVRSDAYSYGIILKLGQSNDTNAKIYIPHSSTRLSYNTESKRSMCFYLRTSYQKTANDRGESEYKSDWFKFMSTDYFAGIPLPWPLQWVPDGFLSMNGATFDKNRYPRLALLYPTGKLPDLRGEFIRGWDANRGVDSGRALLSNQSDAIRNITGSSDNILKSKTTASSGAISSTLTMWRPTLPDRSTDINSVDTGDSAVYKEMHISFDASRVVPTANENRPRNVAFQYICYAA